MASLLVTDELWELRRQMQELKSFLAEARRRDRSVADESTKSIESELARKVSAVADRLERLNQRFGSKVETPANTGKR
jgi:hypothetical protein